MKILPSDSQESKRDPRKDDLVGYTPLEGLPVRHHPAYKDPKCICGKRVDVLLDEYYTIEGDRFCSWECIPAVLRPVEMGETRG